MTQVNYNECPWTDSGTQSNNTISYATTEGLKFPGGWKPSDNKSLNPYGGIYSYIQDPNTGIYKLDVVPNFSGLTWVGTAPYCSANTKDTCINGFKDPKFNGTPYRPTQWAGYASVGQNDNGSSLLNNTMVRTPARGCNTCQSGNMVLCSNNMFMHDSSCPGYGLLSTAPTIINDETDYYTKEPAIYPRGVGHCYYPKDIIKTDDDLNYLLHLKNLQSIHPDLADELAINYCYETDPTDRTCGKDGAGNDITKCTRFKADMNSNDSSQKPCVVWMNSLLAYNRQIDKIDNKSREWCEREENKNTPLCDCIQRESCMNTSTCPTNARKFYKLMTTDHNNIITSATPPECWYKPCYKNLSYAIPIEKTEQCTTYANICNQINNLADSATMKDNQQYLSCSLDAKTGASNGTDPSTSSTNTSKNTIVIIVVVFVTLIVVGAAIIPLFSAAAIATTAPIAATTSVATTAPIAVPS